MVFYEVSAHPDCSSHRMESAFLLLDNVIRVLGLTSIDIMDPRVTAFSSNGIPILSSAFAYDPKSLARVGSKMMLTPQPPPRDVIRYQAASSPTPFDSYRPRPPSPVPSSSTQSHGTHGHGHVHPVRVPGATDSVATAGNPLECPCHALSLAHSPEAARSTPIWTTMPRWPETTDWVEIKKEEARRLVWSSITMLSSDAAWRAAAGQLQLDLHLARPENVGGHSDDFVSNVLRLISRIALVGLPSSLFCFRAKTCIHLRMKYMQLIRGRSKQDD